MVMSVVKLLMALAPAGLGIALLLQVATAAGL